MIGLLPAEADARRFVDYLLTRSVTAHAEESQSGAWQIWVEHDDHVDAGLAELQQFQANPADARFDSAANAAAIRKEQDKATEKRRQNYHDVRTTTFAPIGNATPATYIIVGIAVALFVMTNFAPPATVKAIEQALLFVDPHVETTTTFGSRGTMFYSIFQGQIWRLISPAFLHGGILHILFNMMWMVDLGRRIEPVKGSLKFVGMVLVIGVLSCVAQALTYALSPWQTSHYGQFVGMSGVVSGLFGYAWMCGRFRPYERIAVGQQELGYMLGWLVICSLGLIGPIANAAHWGGLVIGMALGAAPSLWRKRR